MMFANVRMNEQVFDTMSLRGHPDFVISGYPEYATDPAKLDASQRAEIRRAAETIVASLSTRTPVRAFVVVGHADKALRKPVGERAKFEREISQKRADAGREALLKELTRLAGGPAIKHIVQHRGVGVGNLKPVVKHAATEKQMRQNRRIEIVCARCVVTDPHCGV
jgi:flagellar motor protein MotB